MLHKILGSLDLLTAIIFILSLITPIIPNGLITFFGVYLLIKGLIFALILDIASILDILSAGIILISNTWPVNLLLGILIALYLGWKGIISFL